MIIIKKASFIGAFFILYFLISLKLQFLKKIYAAFVRNVYI